MKIMIFLSEKLAKNTSQEKDLDYGSQKSLNPLQNSFWGNGRTMKFTELATQSSKRAKYNFSWANIKTVNPPKDICETKTELNSTALFIMASLMERECLSFRTKITLTKAVLEKENFMEEASFLIWLSKERLLECGIKESLNIYKTRSSF